MYYFHFTNINISIIKDYASYPSRRPTRVQMFILSFKYKFRHNIQISAPRKNWVAFDFCWTLLETPTWIYLPLGIVSNQMSLTGETFTTRCTWQWWWWPTPGILTTAWTAAWTPGAGFSICASSAITARCGETWAWWWQSWGPWCSPGGGRQTGRRKNISEVASGTTHTIVDCHRVCWDSDERLDYSYSGHSVPECGSEGLHISETCLDDGSDYNLFWKLFKCASVHYHM